ncbi:MAG: UbiA prenyltransferase family protein [Candidatus Aenigmarchaeota archaeon]|nr:UbiA prenyltransferase family protein [Candidatus Aenigmarchaeota archaeon]
MLKKYLVNSRPYSWVDLILVGLLAKFSVTSELVFVNKDFFMALSLIFLWVALNFFLEYTHSYSYKGRFLKVHGMFFFALGGLIGLMINPLSFVFLAFLGIFTFIYLQKSRNSVFGNLSCVIRGVIESVFLFYALTFYVSTFTIPSMVLGFLVFMIYTARALVGDIRDHKHNRKAGKRTLPVVYGITQSRNITVIMLLLSAIIQIAYFSSFAIAVPIILFTVSVLFFSNGYVLHHLMIFTTMFFHVNMIYYFTQNDLLFTNLIYLGILLNMIFYPMLKRESNPKFV